MVRRQRDWRRASPQRHPRRISHPQFDAVPRKHLHDYARAGIDMITLRSSLAANSQIQVLSGDHIVNPTRDGCRRSDHHDRGQQQPDSKRRLERCRCRPAAGRDFQRSGHVNPQRRQHLLRRPPPFRAARAAGNVNALALPPTRQLPARRHVPLHRSHGTMTRGFTTTADTTIRPTTISRSRRPCLQQRSLTSWATEH